MMNFLQMKKRKIVKAMLCLNCEGLGIAHALFNVRILRYAANKSDARTYYRYAKGQAKLVDIRSSSTKCFYIHQAAHQEIQLGFGTLDGSTCKLESPALMKNRNGQHKSQNILSRLPTAGSLEVILRSTSYRFRKEGSISIKVIY